MSTDNVMIMLCGFCLCLMMTSGRFCSAFCHRDMAHHWSQLKLSGSSDVNFGNFNGDDVTSRIRENAWRTLGIPTSTVQNVLLHQPSVFAGSPLLFLPERVHIVVFPSHDGAHTVEFPKGSGNNVILAFASEEACRKFAQSLEKQHFFDPMPQQFYLVDLVALSEKLGVFIQVIPEGIDLIPPTQNVKSFGLSPELQETKRYLSSLFDVDCDEHVELEFDEGEAFKPQKATMSVWE